MPENLLSSSQILLYGRVVTDLSTRPPVPPPPGAGPGPVVPGGQNHFLQNQLGGGNPRFARIYGFSHEGHYYDLAKPALFLVHDNGVQADTPVAAQDPRTAKAPDEADRFGVAATAKSFPSDMQVWAYDKSDFSIRLDVQTGFLEHILLEA